MMQELQHSEGKEKHGKQMVTNVSGKNPKQPIQNKAQNTFGHKD